MATPRETGEVIGSRGTAATADVQTSPTDATAGALLNNETTHIGGNVNYTEVNYQPESNYGIGVVRRMRNVSGAGINQQGTVAGTSLLSFADNEGTPEQTQPAVGTWLCLNLLVNNNRQGDFVRIA